MNIISYEEFKNTDLYQKFISENNDVGLLKVQVFTAYNAVPIENTEVVISKDIGNYNYPIRNKNIRNNQNFTIDNVLNILSDLRNSKESMTNIGLKYKINRNTVSKINKGEAYIIKDYDYPAR